MITELMDGLRAIFGALFDKAEQLVEDIKRIIVGCDDRRRKRLSSRKGWDKPVRLDPDRKRDGTQVRCEATVMRWHTAAKGD